MTEINLPACVRGRELWADPATFTLRASATRMRTPSGVALLPDLPLRDPSALRDLQELPHREIVDFLGRVGAELDIDRNPFLQEALTLGEHWSELPVEVLRASYRELPRFFHPEAVREVANNQLGPEFLDGWHRTRLADGRDAAVRAMGARTLHIIAGNTPAVAAMTIVRAALTRGDTIIKTPSNDPFTALAVIRTMYALDPGHPVSRHMSAAYWKGGDADFEERLYRPEFVEKIVAWGGLESVRHITTYLRPGLELIALDPKSSAAVIGPESLADEVVMAEVARRLAIDVAAYNQLLCVNVRVAYVITDGDLEDRSRVEDLARRVASEMRALPPDVSSPMPLSEELADHLDGLRWSPDWYSVIGARARARAGGGRGIARDEAVVVSWSGEPVDFHLMLAGRVVNIVPVPDLSTLLTGLSSATQTVAVFPERLKDEVRDTLPLYGVQRVVSLGGAPYMHQALPQDGMEPVRRMVKWIVDETASSATGASGDS